MKFTEVRHGTCIIEFAGMKFIVDPILYKKESLDPVKGGLDIKNPLVDITVTEEELKNVDGILLTHLHRDHYDPEIINFYGSNILIICSDEYKPQLNKAGFTNVKFIRNSIEINNIEVTLTKGKHGTGIVGKLMGNSYGFLLKSKTKDTLYITGDTVWCKCVEKTIETYDPKYIVAFAGSAIINNTHITMDENDIEKIFEKAPNTKVVAIHMEAWNHCFLTRDKLKNSLKNENLFVPNNGETIVL